MAARCPGPTLTRLLRWRRLPDRRSLSKPGADAVAHDSPALRVFVTGVVERWLRRRSQTVIANDAQP